MKREGRQHGSVRSHEVQNPDNKIVNATNSIAADVKVSSKPTNHSKFTGRCCFRSRCRYCHTHPVSKSKDKAKGTHNHKLKAFDILVGRNGGGGSNYVGLSATAILGQLATRDDRDWDDYYEEEEEEMEYGYYRSDYYNNNDNLEEDILPLLTTTTGGGIEEIIHEPEEVEEAEADDDDDDDDVMSFCEVGFVLELEEAGWFVVAEM